MYARPALCRWNAQLTCPVQDHCTRRPIQKQKRYIKKQDPTPPLLFETMARLESEYQTLVTYHLLLWLQIECHQMVSFDVIWCIHDPSHCIIIIDIQIQNYRNLGCSSGVLQCPFSLHNSIFQFKIALTLWYRVLLLDEMPFYFLYNIIAETDIRTVLFVLTYTVDNDCTWTQIILIDLQHWSFV